MKRQLSFFSSIREDLPNKMVVKASHWPLPQGAQGHGLGEVQDQSWESRMRKVERKAKAGFTEYVVFGKLSSSQESLGSI